MSDELFIFATCILSLMTGFMCGWMFDYQMSLWKGEDTMTTYSVLYIDYDTDKTMFTLVDAQSPSDAKKEVASRSYCYKVLECFEEGEVIVSE